MPLLWDADQLAHAALASTNNFRIDRLRVSDAWLAHYDVARAKFELLFEKMANLNFEEVTDTALADIYACKLGDALRYLAGPPISDDDLKVIADVKSLSPAVLGRNALESRKVYRVIERVIDPCRFPWVLTGKEPTVIEREMALIASSILLAAQRVATERRNDGKEQQEGLVKAFLTEFGFVQVRPQTISTLVQGPQAMQFCGECLLGERKADIVIRLGDTRLMAIECKVSNSATNSVKRLNNDAAAKAEHWLKCFGTDQVVPAAMLSGVFNVHNLVQAQRRGLALFWAHDLDKLGDFIAATK